MKRREGKSREKMTPLGVANGPSTVVPMEKLGPPGIPGVIVFAANFPNDTRQESERLFDYAVRPIKVYATLSKTLPLNERIAGDTGRSDGASYLAARWKNARLDFTSSDGAKFHITPNPDGELSFVEFECAANSIASARVAFQRAVLPILDYLSYLANCPLFIGSIRFHDARNDCDTIDYVSPYRQAIVNDVLSKIFERMRPIYSMYREAKVIAHPASASVHMGRFAASTNLRTARTETRLAFAVLTTERKAA